MNHYEIHVTVEHCNLDHFKRYCYDLGLKPLLIDLQKEQQLMCSKRITDEYHIVVAECLDIMKQFTKRDLEVTRVKIETTLTNHDHIVQYYECHIPVLIRNYDDGECVDSIIETLTDLSFEFHMSKNAFKKSEEGSIYFLTYRTCLGEDLEDAVDKIVNFLRFYEIPIFDDKIEMEACILDTNRDLDKRWLSSPVG